MVEVKKMEITYLTSARKKGLSFGNFNDGIKRTSD